MPNAKGWKRQREGVYVKHPGGSWVLVVELVPGTADRWHWKASGEVANEVLEATSKHTLGVQKLERAQELAREAYEVLQQIGQLYGQLRKIEVRT